jgi:hypothetical protein
MSSSPSRMQDPFHSTQKQYPRCFLQRQIVWACLISIKADCCHAYLPLYLPSILFFEIGRIGSTTLAVGPSLRAPCQSECCRKDLSEFCAK